MKFFRVERHRQLQQGQLIELASYKDIVSDGLRGFDLLYGDGPEKELQAHIDLLFPGGLTEQGNWYLLNSRMSSDFIGEAIQFLNSCISLDQARQEIRRALNNSCIAVIEILFEYVRRSCFPDRPSRFTSVCAWETLNQAKDFRRTHGDGFIWEVECNREPFRADMNLLSLGNSVLTFSYYAHRYWAGLPGIQANVSPCWEVLLTPPVKVLRHLED